MAQLTIYLEDELKKRAAAAAKSAHLSTSKWVTMVIEEKVANEWPQSVLDLIGAWKDDFPDLEEIRSGMGEDVPREEI